MVPVKYEAYFSFMSLISLFSPLMGSTMTKSPNKQKNHENLLVSLRTESLYIHERSNNLTSFDPDVLAEFSRHTDEEALTAASHSFMEVIAITSKDL